MSPRPRTALGGAAVGVACLILVWILAFHVVAFERADASILQGFAGLHRPRVDRVTNFIASLCDPKPYLLLAAVPIVVALVRRRPRVAVTLGGIMLGANLTTQLLKPVLATARVHGVPWLSVGAASWPSGHATAVMSLALCAVIAAPARRRPYVAAGMAAFAVAVCYSFLELAWHYPSDVLGGFLVASVWTLLGVAVLSWAESRWPTARSPSMASDGAGSPRRVQVSVAEALAPVALLVLIALVAAAVIALARPTAVVTYARAHELFLVGAAGIAALVVALAAGATLALRRGVEG
jgi:membrane-associated phospholipid phosphatase